MGYYCTVPQCTSLAGKTKNVKFHRFPRDETMADKWNVILKRGKPYTKYSKVCSLHFTQNDYNVTNMGQWKTLSKDAVPSQNLPKLNPDGSVMVIRKSRTLKYKETRKDEPIDKTEKWSPIGMSHAPPAPLPEPALEPDSSLAYRLQTLHAIANGVSPLSPPPPPPPPAHPVPAPAPAPLKPKKQDAFMQTDPVQDEEEENNQPDNSYSEPNDNSYHSQSEQIAEYPVQYKEPEKSYEPKSYDTKSYESKPYDSKSYDSKSYDSKSYEPPKDYTKQTDDYIPQTDEEYNKEAEKYALGQKSLNGYDKDQYQKTLDYQKMGQLYGFTDKQEFRSYYPNGYTDSAEILRNQQANLQILQQQHRVTENQNFFTEGIKQEVDLSGDDMYERSKEIAERDAGMYETQRRLAQQRSLELSLPPQVKQEPEGCDNVMQPQGSPYGYSNGLNGVQGYYEQLSRPGPEMLIAKQNALAAHTQLWQNTMKRPFFYSESPHYNGPPLLHRYEDIPRILQ